MGTPTVAECEIREVARLIVKEVLIEHIASCPHGKSLLASKWMMVGLCFGTSVASFAGSSFAVGLTKVIMATP